jgi:hypothetical protein
MEPIKAPAAESPAKRRRQTEGELDSAEDIRNPLFLLIERLGLGLVSSISESVLLLLLASGEFAVAISLSLFLCMKNILSSDNSLLRLISLLAMLPLRDTDEIFLFFYINFFNVF